MKVLLIQERHPPIYWRGSTPIKRSLPFYERDGEGYVHRVRSGAHHYDRDTGSLRHTSFGFWCGLHGFILPAGKRLGRKMPARLVTEPTPGRVVCATCEARAIGSGQLGSAKIGRHFVKYKPHVDFFPAAKEGK